MRSLSFWARQNARLARWIIVLVHVLLFFIAFWIGERIGVFGIKFPAAYLYVSSLVYLVIVFVYPHLPRLFSSSSTVYFCRKGCEFVVGLVGFIMIICLANQQTFSTNKWTNNSSWAATSSKDPTAKEILESLKKDGNRELTRQEKRILKREFRKQLKTYVKQKVTGKNKEAEETLLIILAIIGALGLLLLVASLACSLSCNGSDAAAIIVGILGTVAVIWLLVYVVKKITHKKRAVESTKQPDVQTGAG